MSTRKPVLELNTWPWWIDNHLWRSGRRWRCHRLLLLFLEFFLVVLHVQLLMKALLILVLELLREALTQLEFLLVIDFPRDPLPDALGRALRDTLRYLL